MKTRESEHAHDSHHLLTLTGSECVETVVGEVISGVVGQDVPDEEEGDAAFALSSQD